ncbi:MAG: leucyl/phenylalanyl-tRNA--protein transferase [Saprospiraceae bacterium]|nr:leucyl/phenylalanyl-tRNA--protein transferase [Saprospiraceae bacterium]
MYWLDKHLIFPHPQYADAEGLLAIGGDLSLSRLLLAYENGIFPWFNEGDPILWWSPDPRFILYPSSVKVSKSMKRIVRKRYFEIRYDTAFIQVLDACASIPRRGQEGTWLIEEMKEAYIELHENGLAHSVEAWLDGELVGGLYGVSLGRCFFGESMFAKVSNASKACLIDLGQQLAQLDFLLIDCQIHTTHLERMGGEYMDRDDFLAILEKNKSLPTLKGKWQFGNKQRGS